MKVIKKQANSKSCIVCGLDNPFSIKAPFYILEDGSVASIFSFNYYHQSYPERVHGGLITAMLDEIMGRAVWAIQPDIYGVTTSLNVQYRKPVPYETQLKAKGYVTFNSKLGFSAVGYILDKNNNVLAQSTGKFIKLPTEKITNNDMDDEMCYEIKDDVNEIDIPHINELLK